jgi:hypothetical protein
MKKVFFVILGVILTLQLSAQSLQNGGFENGYTSWKAYSKAGDAIVGSFPSTTILPQVSVRSGNYMLRLGGFSYNENYISQIVTLPKANPVKLEIYYQTRSSTNSECGGLFVGSKINVFISGTSILETYLCNYNDVLQWTYGYFDLTAVAGQTVEIKFAAEAANSVWSYIYIDDVSISPSTTGLNTQSNICAANLEQNYPNPFSGNTTVNYTIEKPGKTSMKIFDQTGREITTIFNEYKAPGNYTANISGLNIPSGTYYYKLISDKFSITKKMIIVN